MDLRQEFFRPPDILIADDDRFIRDLLAMYLTDAGCNVRSCVNGAQAWDSIRERHPDLVLLDIRMPQMDGLTVCGKLKDNPETQFIPVVIVTALDAEDEELHAIEAGADDFITKPFNSVILLTRVRSLLRLKRLHDDLESRNHLLRQVLHRYVDHEIADVILTDPDRHLKLGGETRQITVLFADLREFTHFSASHPAPQVVDLLNLLFNEMVELVYKNQGTFDKFLGDAIMAFYGAPISGENDAQRALRTALEMQECFQRLQSEAQDRIPAPLGLGAGIHSGEAIVGNIGSERLMDYTVVGDTVNVARRLQESAKPGEILISDATYRLVPEAEVGFLGPQSLHGRDGLVDVYTLLGLPDR
ncbi:MAG: response regulator [Chloroflexi bacterium]|nr:response regulator [Chloroflexota bacterium]